MLLSSDKRVQCSAAADKILIILHLPVTMCRIHSIRSHRHDACVTYITPAFWGLHNPFRDHCRPLDSADLGFDNLLARSPN